MSTTKIEQLELEIGSNSSSATKGIDSLASSLGKLKKATKGGAGLGSLAGSFKVLGSAMSLKRASKAISGWIQKSNEYVENMNLFTVALGKYADQAKQYAETVGEVMGIDPGEWMRNQGIFMTLADGFGVASDRAYTMSQNLTQLGYDLASFYNIGTEQAMLKLQSGLAGELEPLRRLGYDLSNVRLQQEAYTLGIKKKVSAMTQAEKAELRYYAIMTQVTEAQGDMSRTLEAPANQLRILKAQVEQAARSLGNIFIPALNAILPYVIAAIKVVRILADAIANLVGFTMPEIDYSDLGSSVDQTANALGDAADNAKKLKNQMLGIDELNVISNKDDSSESDSGLGGLGFELPTYDFIGDAVSTRVDEIVEKMKEWLGITDDIDSWSELFDTRLGDILEAVGLIGAGLLLWKVTDTFIASIATLKTLLSSPTHSIAIGVTLTIVGFALGAKGMKDAVEEGVDEQNFAETVGGSLMGTGGTALLGSKIATWITTTFAGSKVAGAITAAGANLGTTTAGATGAALGAGAGGIIAGIPMFIVGIYDAVTKELNWMNGALVGAGATAAGAGIGAIIGACGGPIGAGLGALIGLAIGAVTDLVILVVQKWDEISAFFMKMWNGICTFFEPAIKWFDENIIQPLVSFFEGACLRIGQFFEGCWLIIRAVWEVVSTWFDENVIQPTVTFFKGLWEDISGFFSSLWKDIKIIWNKVATWFDDNIITPVEALFKIVCESIGGYFSDLWEGLKTGVASAMNAVIGVIEGALNWVIRGINKLIEGFNDVVQWAADVLGEDWDGVSLIKEVKLDRIGVADVADTGNYKIDRTASDADIKGATTVTATGFKEGMSDWYKEYLEPTMAQMAENMRKQAEKSEQTVVNIGNRAVSEAVNIMQKANGFVFAK